MKQIYLAAVLLMSATTLFPMKVHADAAVAAVQQAEILVPTSERGDMYFSYTAIFKVYRLGDESAAKKEYCIPSGSTFRIGMTQANGDIAVSVTAFPKKTKGGKLYEDRVSDAATEAKKVCLNPAGTEIPWVDSEYTYAVSAQTLVSQDFRKTAWTFGALVVPFKYYVGKNNAISSSTTIAPYVGYSFDSVRGMNVAFVFSAGLGLVPVNDSTTGSTETKPALSTSLGLLFSSRKNANWSSGILVGGDFLSEADKARDQTASDPWISLFIGTPIK